MSVSRRGSEYGVALSEESITVTSGGGVETLTVPASARAAVVSADGADSRWRVVGTPTSSVGHLLVDGGQVEVFGNDLANFKIVCATATTVAVFVTYYGL